MNFSLKMFKEEYPESVKNWDTKVISWVSRNKSLVKNRFNHLFPKSPFEFVIQVATTRGSILLTSDGDVKNKKAGVYLSFDELEDLGYEM
jgi:hypothetical protein